jgi:hypothetical protein
MLVLANTGWHGRTERVTTPLRFNGRRVSLSICTRFFQVCYMPVFPRGSYAVVTEPGRLEEFELAGGMLQPLAAVPVGFHFRSVCLGYLRAGLLVGSIALLGVAVVILQEFAAEWRPFGWASLAVALAAPIGVPLSYRFGRAGSERAAALIALFDGFVEPEDLADPMPGRSPRWAMTRRPGESGDVLRVSRPRCLR